MTFDTSGATSVCQKAPWLVVEWNVVEETMQNRSVGKIVKVGAGGRYS